MKTYIENEIDEYNNQRKCEKRHEKMRDSLQLKKLLLIVCLGLGLFLTTYSHSEIFIRCNNCSNVETIKENALYICGFFPDTWTCQNPSCGYKNYEGIKYCGLCGTKQGDSSPR